MLNHDDPHAVSSTDIAIIGMSGRFPGAKNIDEFWKNLCDGVESLTSFTDDELIAAGVDPAVLKQPGYVKAGMVLEDVDLFDASFFGYSPREAEMMDPQHRLFLECAWEALENAGYTSDNYQGKIGVYGGAGAPTYLLNNILTNHESAIAAGNSLISMGNSADFLATRVSYQLNLEGPSCTVQCGCSTSLVAIHKACLSILTGECDLALAGGVSVNTRQRLGYLYKKGGIASPDGHCRAFDAGAQGTVGGNAVALVVLKSLANALRDGDHIEAVIKGSAVNNDGSQKVGFTAPSVSGQAAVIEEALSMADVDPATISYVEAHGTATPMGDPIEVAALTKAFRAKTANKQFCAIGSLKTNVGHLDTAAGVAGLIKTALALKNRVIPPSLHFDQPNPEIDFENSPFYVNRSLADWNTGTTPRRAGVSSFGIGGTNVHVILEEPPQSQPSGPPRAWHILPISAKTKTALEAASTNLNNYLLAHADVNLADLAYTYQTGRRRFNERRTFVFRDRDDLLRQLRANSTTESHGEDKPMSLVFMFPGQGSQYLNMGRELYGAESAFRDAIDHCSELLKRTMRVDLREFLFPTANQSAAAEAELNETYLAQPALFVIEYALAKLLAGWGIKPQAMIGHSIGEYVAACLAGVFSLADALSLIALRGRLMQALPRGAMIVVPLCEKDAQALTTDDLSVAAVNAESLCVLSGTPEAVEHVKAQLNSKRIEVRSLHTSRAFHSRMVEPMMDEFGSQLKKIQFHRPQIPYVSNLTGKWITESEATDPSYWLQHLRQTVRFEAGIRLLLETPGRVLLELGPGRTLSTLARQQTRGSNRNSVISSLPQAFEEKSEVAGLFEALAQLWRAGARIDWQAFNAHERRHRLSLPAYPFERKRYWVEPGSAVVPKQLTTEILEKRQDIRDWFYTPSWRRVPLSLESVDKASQQSWLVFSNESALVSGVIDKLAEDNQRVITVSAGKIFSRRKQWSYTLNPKAREDYERLFEDLRAQGIIPRKIIYFWTLNEDAELSVTSPSAEFYKLLFLSQSLVRWHSVDPVALLVVSSNSQEVTGEEKLCPERTAAMAFCKILSQEYPNISCTGLDIQIPAAGTNLEKQIVERLIGELQTGTAGEFIAYRGTHRWKQTFEPLKIANSGDHLLREHGVYLIIGGLGNIGLELAAHLGKTLAARLALVGRHGLPARAEWTTWLTDHQPDDPTSRRIKKIREIEEQGGTVLVIEADAADEEKLMAAVETIEAHFGRIDGVVYAAGATAESSLRSLLETDIADSEKHFQSKAQGLIGLARVLRHRRPDFCLLFSSLSSVLGGLGFAAYCAANLFMDVFAYGQNRESVFPWITVNWDGWDIKVDEQRREFPTGAGSAMSVQEGLLAFRSILATNGITQVVVSTTDLQSRIDRWIRMTHIRDSQQKKSDVDGSVHARPELTNAYVAPRNEIESIVAGFWQTLLGVDRVGIHDNFFELGGHSLLGIQLISRLRQEFRLELPLRTLFEQPTVEALARFVQRAETPNESQPQIEHRQNLTVDELLREQLEQDLVEVREGIPPHRGRMNL